MKEVISKLTIFLVFLILSGCASGPARVVSEKPIPGIHESKSTVIIIDHGYKSVLDHASTFRVDAVHMGYTRPRSYTWFYINPGVHIVEFFAKKKDSSVLWRKEIETKSSEVIFLVKKTRPEKYNGDILGGYGGGLLGAIIKEGSYGVGTLYELDNREGYHLIKSYDYIPLDNLDAQNI